MDGSCALRPYPRELQLADDIVDSGHGSTRRGAEMRLTRTWQEDYRSPSPVSVVRALNVGIHDRRVPKPAKVAR